MTPKSPHPLKGPRRKPPRAPLTLTTCPGCGAGPWNGDVVRADDEDCPACNKGDRDESRRARFAPGKHGPLVSGSSEVEE